MQSPADAARALALAERLLGCYQHALGHDLPNQLVAIQGLARLVQQEAGESLGPDTAALLDRLADQARRAHALAAALADVGRACRMAEPPAPVALGELCREAAAEANWLCPDGGLRYDETQPLPTLRLPPVAARRVFVELCLHAARRAPEGRPVRVEVGAEAGACGTVVRVRDDGPAPPLPWPEQAFEPPSLGLFLARQLVEGWGGSLRAEAANGAGCTFLVTLPDGGP
jgi:signal transduction histidine kinase